jgi:transcriptional regulator with XRE-family HTH domain
MAKMERSEIASRIIVTRKKTSLSQQQPANKSGLNLRTIQRIENNETVPRVDSLRRLAIALNSSPGELINWKNKED